jgi:hypothetical protein
MISCALQSAPLNVGGARAYGDGADPRAGSVPDPSSGAGVEGTEEGRYGRVRVYAYGVSGIQ